MRIGRRLMGVIVWCLAASGAAAADEAPPAWAYPVNPPDFKPPADDGTPRRVPGSDASYTLTQTRDRFLATDWHPADRPPMPEVVARGRKPEVYACGWCHRATGTGGPENANLAGLPAAYIRQQIDDIRSGARRSSVPKRPPVELMAQALRTLSDAEAEAAAAYFASIPFRPKVRVVESDNAPKTIVTGWHLAMAPSGGEEPLGRRIIEVPEDLEQFVSRDPNARFVAYAPPGSIAKGRELATSGGNGRTVPCAGCHGADLKGAGVVPGIAGRSPSYIVRQLYDFKSGARAGAAGVPMKATVEQLDLDDMIALAAYVASGGGR